MGGAISSLDAENLDLFDCFPHVDKFALVSKCSNISESSQETDNGFQRIIGRFGSHLLGSWFAEFGKAPICLCIAQVLRNSNKCVPNHYF
jgi:hypothetical protein